MYQVSENLSIHDLNHKFIKNLSLVLYYHINFSDNTIPRDFYHVIYNQPIYHRSQIILHFPARFLYTHTHTHTHIYIYIYIYINLVHCASYKTPHSQSHIISGF